MRMVSAIMVFAFLSQSYAEDHVYSYTKDKKATEQSHEFVYTKDAKDTKATTSKEEYTYTKDAKDAEATHSDEEEDLDENDLVQNLLDRMDDKWVDQLVDRSVDKLVDRWIDKKVNEKGTDLDKTTLGKVHPDKGPATISQPRQLSAPAAFKSRPQTGLKIPRSPFAAPQHHAVAPRAQMHAPQASLTECPAFDILGGPSEIIFFNLGGLAGPASSEPKEKALARKYSVVGNWDDWKSFHPLNLKEESKADGTSFLAEVPVPVSKDIEFQIVGDGDWKNRYFPGGDGHTIFGPSHEGHGENWRHSAPTKEGQKMRVKFFPTAGEKGSDRKLESELV